MQRQSSSEHLEWYEGNLESGLARAVFLLQVGANI